MILTGVPTFTIHDKAIITNRTAFVASLDWYSKSAYMTELQNKLQNASIRRRILFSKPIFLLCIPALAMTMSDGVRWAIADFMVMAVLL
jgi:hypothetical protein